MRNTIDYYSKHGLMSKMNYRIFKPLKSIEDIVKTVQEHMIHQAWSHHYGVEAEKRKQETMMRGMSEKIEWLDKNKKPILGICRDFSLFTVALCRDNDIPARTRCGFATYFEKNKYIDHWVVEYYDRIKECWIMIDPQIDDLQRKLLNISFDTMNLSSREFILGGDAWAMCRTGNEDPMKFGIFQWWGYDYLMCNMLLDAHALMKMPMHPWDKWEGIKSSEMTNWSEEDYKTLDGLSKVLLTDSLDDIEGYIHDHKTLQLPEDVSLVEVF